MEPSSGHAEPAVRSRPPAARRPPGDAARLHGELAAAVRLEHAVTDAGSPTPTATVQQLQQVAGNTAVARLLTSTGAEPAEPAEAAGPAAPAASVSFLSVELTTHAQVVAAARFLVEGLRIELGKTGPTDRLHGPAVEWISQVEAWFPFWERQGEQPLSGTVAAVARRLLDDGEQLRRDLREGLSAAGRAAAQEKLAETRQAARAAAAEADRLRLKLYDAMRAAYRSDDESLLAQVLDITGNVTSIGMGLFTLERELSGVVASRLGTELAPLGRYATALGQLNNGLAAVNLALAATGDRAATELEEGSRLLGVAVGAFSSIGTLVGLPDHVGLYASVYLVPMTKAVLAGLTRLTERLHERNQDWVELLGQPLYYAAEPGGKPVWDFMVAVMHAASAADIPAIPEPVSTYFLAHRDRLELVAAGTGAVDALPTGEGWHGREPASPAARVWIFERRVSVWAMLYGSTAVPARGGRATAR